MFPFTFISCTVTMSIFTETMCLIFFPVSFVLISINMSKFSFSMSFIIFPRSYILSTIWPDLNSMSMPHISLPLSFIFSSIFKYKFFSIFTLIKVLITIIWTFIPIFNFIFFKTNIISSSEISWPRYRILISIIHA